jgi:hypothetical protein
VGLVGDDDDDDDDESSTSTNNTIPISQLANVYMNVKLGCSMTTSFHPFLFF